MANANLTMGINGVDKTAAAFTSVKNRARATSAQIRSIMGGAIAAAGAFLSVRAVSQTVGELGSLSDQAMKAGTSVEFLTQAATAFQVAGLNISVDQLTKSFQYLEKTTGKKGEGAFWEAVQSIAAIEDPAKRGAELAKTFGRSGMELQPLINGGADAVQKFRDLQELMPRVSTAAAEGGDAIKDAQTILGGGISSMWQNVVGYLCDLWGKDFPGGVRAGALNAVNWLEYAGKVAFNWLGKWGARIAAIPQYFADWWHGGLDYADEQFAETIKYTGQVYDDEIAKLDKARDDYVSLLKTKSVDDLANALGGGGSAAQAIGGAVGESAAKAAQRVSNQLIMGESNAARRLSILGPDFQDEQKKQTKTLESIEEIMKDIRDMDRDVQTIAATDLGL